MVQLDCSTELVFNLCDEVIPNVVLFTQSPHPLAEDRADSK
jgi:hypothetical protein